MAIATRSSVMAIKKEVSEGVALKPTSGTDGYLALQDGFSMEPSFDSLDNSELQSSIGISKPVLGLENPTASINHYIRHSGVEGTEPNMGLLFETAFGTVDIEATEYDTVAGSTAGDTTTRAKVIVDAAEGANFSRGQALLIKDGTNNYSIRNVYSISTDDLNLSFNLSGAPASGVNLGKAVTYSPANSHPTFTTWLFRGNGGALEVMTGTRVTEFGIEASAGEFLNGSFQSRRHFLFVRSDSCLSWCK
jgi:hypothetical protein